MKASVSPWAIFAAVGLAVISTIPASGQDVLVLTNGQRREAKITGIDGDKIKFKAGPVESSLPLAQIQSVTMEAPKEFQQALEKWQAGDAAGTLKILTPLVTTFRKVPAPWAELASALLGEVLIANGDVAGAEKAFADFQAAYPQATGLADLGLALLAIEKGDFTAADAKARPVAEQARKTLLADSAKGAEFGQALYIMGAVEENAGNLPEALDNYLLVTTVFYSDAATADKARQRAEALAKKNVNVP